MIHTEIIVNKEYCGFNPVQFGFENCCPSHSFGPAVRSHWLLHYVVSGFGFFRRDGKQYNLSPGEVFVIPPYLETYYQADAKNPWYYIWIGFTADAELEHLFSPPVLSVAGMGDIFEDMRRCKGMENGRSAFLSAKLWELASLIMDSGKAEADYIEKALNCMRSEYMTQLSVDGIAARLNLDRSYFSTLFKEQVGVPPGQYLINMRLEKAAELMLHHGESPTTAALSVGYTDIYHFSKAFKAKFGSSPRNYIKKDRG